MTQQIEALQAVRDFYQQYFEIMPVAFQTIDDLCEAAIDAKRPRPKKAKEEAL